MIISKKKRSMSFVTFLAKKPVLGAWGNVVESGKR
jgi:hypothetical protein